MKALVIYDVTGKIWSIVYGEEEAPQGLTSMFVDISEGAVLTKIDVTDPEGGICISSRVGYWTAPEKGQQSG